MKVLVFNGSPRGKNSNTMILTNKFIEGLNYWGDNDVKIVEIKNKKIEHCLGCFACWKKEPFKCIIDDDISDILNLIIKSELIIWSFPLYHYNVPSKMKSLMDRTLPLSPLNIRKQNYYGILPDNTNKKHIIISTCGLNEDNYSSINDMFSLNYGEKNLEHIYLKAGECINIIGCEALSNYLNTVKAAGMEYYLFKKFSESTKNVLNKPIFDSETYQQALEAWINDCP